MIVSVATATYYYLPFEQTLDIIAGAGFKDIELNPFWERKNWSLAGHIKDRNIAEIVQLVQQSGLKVSSLHDGGGVLEQPDSIRGFIDPQVDEYLDQLGYAPGCIIFHTPHIEGLQSPDWWEQLSPQVIRAAEAYSNHSTLVTIENMPPFDGYTVPVTQPEEMLHFVSGTRLGVNMDTTHYAQMGVDFIQAAQILREKIKTIHLSDYAAGKNQAAGSTHVFLGDGQLDFTAFFDTLDISSLYSITLECYAAHPGENARELGTNQLIERLRLARQRLNEFISRDNKI